MQLAFMKLEWFSPIDNVSSNVFIEGAGVLPGGLTNVITLVHEVHAHVAQGLTGRQVFVSALIRNKENLVHK